MKSRYLYLASLLMLLLVASSCMKDWEDSSPNDNPNENSEIVLRIQAPGSFSSATTRGLTLAQEGAIEDIWVLAFDKTGTLVDIRRGENISSTPPDGASNIRSFTVKLKRSEDTSDTYSLMTLANCNDILSNTIGTDIEAATGDLSYASIASRLRDGISSKMYSDGGSIPMWGETPQMILEKKGNSIDLKIMRAIARIDVGIGSRMFNDGAYSWSGKNDSGEIIPFEMTDVYIISPNNAYSVVPLPDNISTDKSKVTKPTIPAGTQAFALAESQDKFRFTDTSGEITRSGSTDATNTWGSYTTQSIYIPESDVKMAEDARSGDANHENRMAIVIGGKYGNTQKVTYYRLDFARDGNIMDVLRNHLYQFNIKKVSGEGYNDVETAYRSMATNMAVEVLDWNDAEMSDVAFDGQYYFSITSRKVEFTPMGNETQTLRMKTNVDNFEMFSNTAGEVGLKAMSKPTYKHEEMGYEYTLTKAGTDEYDLVIKSVKHNVSNTIPNRLEDWTIRAGRLNMPLKVDQQYTVLYVSYINGASATLMPEGTAGAVKIPIHIMALVPVQIETEGDDNGAWIDLGDFSGLSTAVGGLYQASIDVTVPTCPLLADGKKTRQGIIRVTPQGEDSRVFNITQEAPYLSFIKNTEYIPRKNGTTYTSFVEVNTNIRKSDLEIVRENPLGTDKDRIQIGSDFYNVDATRERFVRFDVKTDMTTALQLSESSADFKVKIKDGTDYGTLTPPIIKCVIERGSLKFNWYWRWASINGSNDYSFSNDDETITYIYPWQSTDVTFNLTSNIGGEYDATNANNKLGKGTIAAGTPSTDSDGNSVTPYVFTFNNANYNSKGDYMIFFKGDPTKNDNKEYSKDIVFRQGVQMWNRTVLPNNGNVGKDGYVKGTTKIEITGNVEWEAVIDSWNPSGETSWLELREGDSGAWTIPSSATPLKVDSRVTAPQEHSGAYPLESVLTKKTPLYVAVDSYNTLNMTPESRSAKITFTNRSFDATKGGANIATPTVNITQYAPILAHVSNELPEKILGSGGTYNVVARTNLQGWGVKVYPGLDNNGAPVTTKAFGTATPIIAHQAAENRQLALTVPANPTAANRQFSFWLYSTEFPGASNEIKFAEKQQVVALDMTIAITSRTYTAGIVSQIVITDPGNAGWTLSTSGDWLRTSTSTSSDVSTVDRNGIGTNTSWYVYATQNAGAERKGTISLKTLDGTVVKTIEIIQNEAPPKITYYQGGSINAQGRGKQINVTVYGSATLSVNNGFGISDNTNPLTRSSVDLTAGSYTYYITRYENFGNGDQTGTVTLSGSTGKATQSVKQHTCVSNYTIGRSTTTYLYGHTNPGSQITVQGTNMAITSATDGITWGLYGGTSNGSVKAAYDYITHASMLGWDKIPYCTIHCPLNEKPIGTLPAR